MAIVKAETKKEYALEHQLMVRVLSSGNKLTNALMKKMGLKAGIAQEKNEDGSIKVEGKPGDKVFYAADKETGKVYLYKAKENEGGAVIGATKSFSSNAVRTALLNLAVGADIKKGEGKIALDTPIKNNLQIRFSVSDTPINEDGVDFYEVTFKEAIVAEEKEKEEKKAKVNTSTKAPVEAKSSNW